MQLNTNIEAERVFAQWQLDVGQGLHTNDRGFISPPDHFRCRENTIGSLIDTIYPGISTLYLLNQYFLECIVLSSLNADVDSLNKYILEKFPGWAKAFHSTDFIPSSKQSGEDDLMLNYPVEYLNEINCSGLPLAKLELKVECL